MHYCISCDYYTNTNHNFNIHLNSKKHFYNVNGIKNSILYKTPVNSFNCINCKKEFKHQSGLSRHKKGCHRPLDNIDIEYVKKDYTHKIELYEQKLELYEKKLEIQNLNHKLEVKELENKLLQTQIQTQIEPKNQTVNNTVNNTINNTVNITQNLNVNFNDVLDMNTFIENLKKDYGLTAQQTETILNNLKMGGINACISSLFYFLKVSAALQYKDIQNKMIELTDIILPFLLSDKYLREHFEKNINGGWDRKTSVENIKKIVSIIDQQIFQHHNEYMLLNNAQNKKLVNGILKSSEYSNLSNILHPELYKKIEENDNEKEENNEDDDIEEDQESQENNNDDIEENQEIEENNNDEEETNKTISTNILTKYSFLNEDEEDDIEIYKKNYKHKK